MTCDDFDNIIATRGPSKGGILTNSEIGALKRHFDSCESCRNGLIQKGSEAAKRIPPRMMEHCLAYADLRMEEYVKSLKSDEELN